MDGDGGAKHHWLVRLASILAKETLNRNQVPAILPIIGPKLHDPSIGCSSSSVLKGLSGLPHALVCRRQENKTWGPTLISLINSWISKMPARQLFLWLSLRNTMEGWAVHGAKGSMTILGCWCKWIIARHVQGSPHGALLIMDRIPAATPMSLREALVPSCADLDASYVVVVALLRNDHHGSSSA